MISTNGRGRVAAVVAALAALAPPRAAPAAVAPGAASPPPSTRAAIFQFEGVSLPAEIAAAPLGLAKAVRDRLTGAGYAVMEPALTLPDTLAAVGCPLMEGACATRLGAYLGVAYVVTGRLSMAPAAPGGRSDAVRVEIWKWRAADGALEASVDEVLPGTVTAITASFDALGLKLAAPAAAALPVARPAPATAPAPVSGEILERRGPAGIGPAPGLIVAAAGAFLLGVAIGTGVGTAATRTDFDANPRMTIEDFEEAVLLERRGKRLAATTTGLLISGSVVLVAGGALVGLHLATRRLHESPSFVLDLEVGPAPRVLVRVPFGGPGSIGP